MTDRHSVVHVTAPAKGERLDRVLAQNADLSRSRLKALILAGAVTIGGSTIRDPGHRVNAGDVIAVAIPPDAPAEPAPRGHPAHIVHEDDALIVIDKPRGLVVHPAAGNPTGTLVNALICPLRREPLGIGGVKRPGIVHRLDKDTTGLMVVAKTDRAHARCRRSSPTMAAPGRSNGPIWPLSGALPDRPKGTIDAPIDRHPKARDKQAVRQGGREAVTHWERLEAIGADGKPVASLLSCRLETGRTHQIRVHLAHIGHPLLGDDVYGPGFKTKAGLLHGARSPWRRSKRSADRRCTPICWVSSTR